MIEKLPEIEGFTSIYNEFLDAVVFTHEPSGFYKALSLHEIEAIDRLGGWDMITEDLNHGVCKVLTEQLVHRYKTGE